MVIHYKTLVALSLVSAAVIVLSFGANAATPRAELPSLLTPCAAQSMQKVETAPKGWLGVEVQDLTPELLEVLELDEDTEGVLVAGVVEGGPAEKAGILKGDVIVSLNAKPIEDASGLVASVGKAKPGETVTVALLRDGEKKTVRATLAKKPASVREDFENRVPEPKTPETTETPEIEVPEAAFPNLESLPSLEHFRLELNRGRLGVSIIDLNADLGSYFGSTKGALVTEVLKGTAAEEAGIKAGDVIVRADGKPVESKEDLIKILSKREVGEKVEIVVLRKGKDVKLSATLEEGPFVAMLRGIKKKGSSLPERYITPGVNRLRGNVELQRRLDDMSRQMDKLRKELDKLKEDLKSRRE